MRRDGQRNPEVDQVPDRQYLKRMISHVTTLGEAYYFTGTRAYAAKLASEVRAWFVTPSSRMNPNLKYAQVIKGAGREGQGIIDSNDLPKVIDAITLTRRAGVLSSADLGKVHSWFESYLRWLRMSRQGRVEAAFQNNRGTWYRAQVVAIGAFVGEVGIARAVAAEGRALIDRQVGASGAQPEELARTNPWEYSAFNLTGLFRYAIAARAVGVDLLQHSGSSPGKIDLALRYLVRYLPDGSHWPYGQIAPVRKAALATAIAYGDYLSVGRSPELAIARASVPATPDIQLAFPGP